MATSFQTTIWADVSTLQMPTWTPINVTQTFILETEFGASLQLENGNYLALEQNIIWNSVFNQQTPFWTTLDTAA